MLLHVLSLDVLTHSLDVSEVIEQLYVSNDLRATLPSRASSLTLRVERADSPHAEPIAPPAGAVFAETNLCTGPCYYASGRFFSASDSPYWHRMDYDLDARVIRANVAGIYYDVPQAIVSNLIRPILQSFLLPFHGLKTLHGAVASKNDRTVFLVGAGGMGKSTAIAQLMRDGYDLISDDGPFFTLDGRSAFALSSLDFLHVTENTLALFPELAPHVVGGRDHREKFAVRRTRLQRDDAWRRPLRVSTIARLRRGPVERPRVTRLSKQSVMRELLNESMIVFRPSVFRDRSAMFTGYSDFILELVAGVVGDAEAYEVEFANHHLAALPELLDRLTTHGG